MSEPLDESDPAPEAAPPALLEELRRQIAFILACHPRGLSEYELIQALQGQDAPLFEADVFRDSLQLFRVHFMIFHVLHRLREEAIREGRSLIIDPLRIHFRPLAEGHAQAVAEHDPMAEYYGDLANLRNTDRAQLEAMLKGFWRKLMSGDRRREALRILGLDNNADATAIKQRYRQLARQHHPDRGGDTARLQEINAAMAVLESVKA